MLRLPKIAFEALPDSKILEVGCGREGEADENLSQ